MSASFIALRVSVMFSKRPFRPGPSEEAMTPRQEESTPTPSPRSIPDPLPSTAEVVQALKAFGAEHRALLRDRRQLADELARRLLPDGLEDAYVRGQLNLRR